MSVAESAPKKAKLEDAKKVVVVIYHFPCPDGAYAALAAHLFFKARSDAYTVRFVPARTELAATLPADSPDVYENVSEVIFLDFIGSAALLKAVCALGCAVVLLDHHKTALEIVNEWQELPATVDNRITMEQSGATLAWQYFTARLKSESGEASELVEDEARRAALDKIYAYIEDHDLWRNALPDTKDFSTGFAVMEFDLDCTRNARMFDKLFNLDFDGIVVAGKSERHAQKKIVAAELARRYTIELGRERGEGNTFGRCLAILTTHSSLRSEMGNQLASISETEGLLPIGAICYVEPSLNSENIIKVSLRSKGDQDTTMVSKAYGGGGHLNASSFKIAKSTLAKWKVTKPITTKKK